MKARSTYRWPFISALFFGIACGPRTIRSIDEVVGKYTYSFPTGQVEVLHLDADLSYRQEFFGDSDSFQKDGDPLFTNDGKWRVDKGNTIILVAPLSFCKNKDIRKVLSEPVRYIDFSLPWVPATRNQNATLWLNDDDFYVLQRVQEP
jgi:hypothetical protein